MQEERLPSRGQVSVPREAGIGQAGSDELMIELPAGGSLGFAGFGDPGGVPCFAFHGTASSRLMPGWMFSQESLAAARVRMIGLDRPGYGLSKMPGAAGFSDWPARSVRSPTIWALAGSPCWRTHWDRRSHWPADRRCRIGWPPSACLPTPMPGRR